ncbi:MAG: bacterioferritin [Burkholderiaceae bacterium]|jgi:bacterioferritin|nr:bacterioferritin [Burkholderiaceae bacterium]
MKGDPRVTRALDEYLSFELTGHRQYLLHGATCRHWGFSRLADVQHAYSAEETTHAGRIMARILLLGATPSMKSRREIDAHDTVAKQLDYDRELVSEAVDHLRAAIGVCEECSDYVSRDLLAEMLDDEELHLDWLRKQLSLIDRVGLQDYLQAQM